MASWSTDGEPAGLEILALTSTTFDQGSHRHARAWVLVARRRVLYPA
jgi:hypothetical protein